MTHTFDAQRAPLIAVVSAIRASILAAEAALRRGLPGAIVWNILDDRLIVDLVQQGGMTVGLQARMNRLLDHAAAEGADGVLLSCSLYAQLTEPAQERLGIPVVGPDDAAFTDILDRGFQSVALVSSVALALEDSTDRARDRLGEGASAINPLLALDARKPSLLGDAKGTADAIAQVLRRDVGDFDAVLLANYSLAPAVPFLTEELGIPVLVGAGSAADELRRRLATTHPLSSTGTDS
ncbi:aspartate/glutamate racemase family protein [Rathayibacter sp. VKM Ac-2801]|uniref:aspartate/glutamate racemase family protein n=1 Tax=Rathayibacter sp. VKM Ac-2801 TaxID=2609255 RepID=UPI00131FAEE9|nr:aspartate/glutamate racemase family protein [Rathayibacter sp. VKM Ac-2801]QHC71734.1 hypothetical protein GSU45_15975 [Rathayibacter sp. VKM Ac-2801]